MEKLTKHMRWICCIPIIGALAFVIYLQILALPTKWTNSDVRAKWYDLVLFVVFAFLLEVALMLLAFAFGILEKMDESNTTVWYIIGSLQIYIIVYANLLCPKLLRRGKEQEKNSQDDFYTYTSSKRAKRRFSMKEIASEKVLMEEKHAPYSPVVVVLIAVSTVAATLLTALLILAPIEEAAAILISFAAYLWATAILCALCCNHHYHLIVTEKAVYTKTLFKKAKMPLEEKVACNCLKLGRICTYRLTGESGELTVFTCNPAKWENTLAPYIKENQAGGVVYLDSLRKFLAPVLYAMLTTLFLLMLSVIACVTVPNTAAFVMLGISIALLLFTVGLAIYSLRCRVVVIDDTLLVYGVFRRQTVNLNSKFFYTVKVFLYKLYCFEITCGKKKLRFVVTDGALLTKRLEPFIFRNKKPATIEQQAAPAVDKLPPENLETAERHIDPISKNRM